MPNNYFTLCVVPCEPTPAEGYTIDYRPAGSTEAYRRWPTALAGTPVVVGGRTLLQFQLLFDEDPLGTEYEGFVYGNCGEEQLGEGQHWQTGDNPPESESGSASASPEEPGVITQPRYIIVNEIGATGSGLPTRAKITFDPYPGADHYTLEVSSDDPVSPPTTGWVAYTAQPIVPTNTYLNAFDDGVGPGGIPFLHREDFNEPWVRIRAWDASNVQLAETVFQMFTGLSVVPPAPNRGQITYELVTPDGDDGFGNIVYGTTRFCYPGTAIPVGYRYYYPFGTAATGTTPAVTSGDTPTSILQKFADIFGAGIVVVGTCFDISNQYAEEGYPVGCHS